MPTNNERPEIKPESLDAEHELPASPARADEGAASEQQIATPRTQPATGTDQEGVNEERNTLLDRMARLQAEFDNARKRAAREQQEFRKFALADAINSLLPILDSFDRALRAPAQNPEEFRSGIELIRKQFENALTSLGVTPIPSQGETFNPRVHQAVEIVDTTSANDNQVLEELQPGYNLRGRLLRPAMVRVARNPKRDSQPEAA